MYKIIRIAAFLLFMASTADAYNGVNIHHNGGKIGINYHYGDGSFNYNYSDTIDVGGNVSAEAGKAPQKTTIGANGVYEAKVISITDGDTIKAQIGDTVYNVRFIGVDTPETKHPDKPVEHYGKEASEYTEEALKNRYVWLETDVQAYDRYNHLLAYVWLDKPDNTENEGNIKKNMFNAQLALDGYAKAMTVPPNTKYADLFYRYEHEARENGKGLWKGQN
jgi:micrococcal nuclease